MCIKQAAKREQAAGDQDEDTGEARPVYFDSSTAKVGLDVSALASFARAAANDAGSYARRALLSGQPSIEPWNDQVGATPLAQHGVRIAEDRLSLGYRFNSTLAIEGADLRTYAPRLEGTNDSTAVAGAVTASLSDN